MARFGYYSIYINKHDEDPLQNMEVVRESFCVMAALLTFIWFLAKRMWIWGIGLFLLLVGMTYIEFVGIVDLQSTYVVRAVLFAYLGTSAYDLYGLALQRRGYSLEAVVIARDEMEAKLRYLKDNKPGENKTEKVVSTQLPPNIPGTKPPELKW
ncbi:MAG: DUF2628 domain-containing protein [Rickettsiales bacterium]|nr:DUF2628 domain-containing protein [Rickettsiales bacterium]